ncbi:MAG: adenylate/guanylate cyclase domain-containing protein [Candidatus Marinimicrobia bacterium]|nr:adenylate/guanylate cyclase domain-containing protein [Candidatus Neomarinimicrobiota bacterium]|tara:strand:- start:6470 stop:8209 length:1740 start_codon:yes stop_codon:yes gene_type:complete
MERKLTTIFASDVVGFSKMMGEDEVKTLKILNERRLVIDKIINENGGIIFGSAGDSVIAEFSSPIKASEAAIAIQSKMKTMNQDKVEKDKMTFRVGINIGDVMVSDDNLFGDAVNIAARLEAAAKPSGICVSKTLFDMINRKIMASFEDAGELELKNIDFPIKAFHVLDNKGTPRFNQDSETIETVVKESEPGSVAVMFFKNLSNDEEQEYFCEGFSEDLLSMLSRYNKLVVISSHASFAYREKSKTYKEIGNELGVRYVIHGSVRKLGPRMRINANLVSTDNEKSIWSNNFDLLVEEVFDVQDKIAEEIVSTIVGRVEADALNNIKSKRPENMDSYDLVLKGLEYAKKGNVIKENTERAVELFEKAIETEPSYARAHAWRACTLSNLADWQEDPDPKLFESAIGSAKRALELDPSEPEVHRIIGALKLWYERDHDMAKYHFEKARDLCPSDVFIISRYAIMLIYFSEFEKALSELNRAKRLDPFSHDLLFGPEGICQYYLGNYNESVQAFKKVKVKKNYLFYIALTYKKMGDENQASEKLKEAHAITGMSTDSFIDSQPFNDKQIVSKLKSEFESISE